MDNNEVLKYLSESGIIDISSIQQQIELEKTNKLVEKHPYKYWQGTNGQWYVYLPDIQKGRILKQRKTEEGIKKVIAEYQKEVENNPTVEEIFHEWNDRRLELEKITKPTYERNNYYFKRHFNEFGFRRIRSITPDEVADFLEEQIPKHNLSAKAFAGLKGITKGILIKAKKKHFINWNVQEMFYDLDVSERNFKRTIKEDDEEVFSEEETEALIKFILDNPDIRNLGILLMFITGLRVGELASLKHEDIHDNSIDVRRTETRVKNKKGTGHYYYVKEYPKTRAGIRTIAVPRQYQDILDTLYERSKDTEYVFTEDGVRIITERFRKRLVLLCKTLGIKPKSPHKIRKTYGTILLDNGIDKRLVLDQMGHNDISTSENYYHRNRKTLEKKLDIVSSIPEFHK